MVRRKGELSSAMIDQGWPHQVALEARLSMGDRYYTVHYFCERLSICPRGHYFRRDNKDFNVYCFAEREDAERFQARFGGEFIEPTRKARWQR